MSRIEPTARRDVRAPQENTRDSVRLVVHGSNGRMGQRVIALAQNFSDCTVVQALDRGDALALPRGGADLVVDFTSDEGARRALGLAEELGAALLVGTTGLAVETRGMLERAAAERAVLIAPNTSLGVAVARRLVVEAARLLPGFDVDIVETHHTRKVDAPSGTARSLAEAVERGRGAPLEAERVHAIRAGDVVGDHVVSFSGPGERLEISHIATSRDLFALGALRMAKWLAAQRPGLHSADAWFEHFVRGA